MNEADSAHHFERSRRGYDRLAPVYEGLEALSFGNALMKARTALLPSLPPLETALVLGEGDGRFVCALLKSQPRCQVTCVEQSPGMVQRAHARLSKTPSVANVNFSIQDAASFQPEKRRYDALFTTFFLDCFTEPQLRELIPKWLRGLKRRGLWYYVDFEQPENGFAALRARMYLSTMHTFFRWQTDLQPRRLADPHPIFIEHGLSLDRAYTSNNQLLTTGLYRYA